MKITMPCLIVSLCLLITDSMPLLQAESKVSDSSSIHTKIDGKSQQHDSLGAAIEATRASDRDSKSIVLGPGRIFLGETLLLDARDTGLSIEGSTESSSELIGGRRISGWKKNGDFLIAHVPGTRDGTWNFRTLLVNGRSAQRTRYPEQGRLKNINKWKVRWMSTAQGGWQRKPKVDDLTRMIYRKEDLGSDFDLNNAEFTVFHKWDETLVGVKSHDPKTRTVVFSNEAGHPLGAFGVKDYVVWNLKKGMTKPGQWYLDRKNEQLVYWPLPGESLASLDIIAPVLENVIRLENTEGITLKNLTIRAATTPLITGDFAAKLFDGAISARNTQKSLFDHLEISGVTGWGMKLFGDHLKVKNCHIHHVGAGAIRLIGSYSTIENNHLHHVGEIYPSAIALYVGVTDPNMKDEWEFGKNETHAVLGHNEIHDAPYVGIGIGGSHHLIEYNKISRVMLELTDGSGIYATFCGQLKMRNNVVRDIDPGPVGQNHAYYLDELSDGVLVENNISIGVPAASHNHMANDNTYRNNIFICEGPMKITMPRCTAHSYKKNIFVSDKSVTFLHPKILELEMNVIQTPKVIEQTMETYKRHTPGPMSVPPSNNQGSAGLIIEGDDISFAAGSPAYKLGIRPIKGSQAGLLKK
ncbi:MAG: right-handed parallel beta-helix repeat-containing protein [Planctomycetes bacterium]|nr:right-handed parallel beta-helix repeat-containing protein [Planctomycetota bacterium]